DSRNHFATYNENDMGQLILGITVPETAGASSTVVWHANRRLRLEISERAGAPRYALTLHDGARPENTGDEPGLIGPPIILTRAEPVEIEVVNRLTERTAIHWHGIELESYYDGVPGWSGVGNQITQPIEPGTSFVARMTPPRAGTFIYHTHWHDPSQLTNGIYGPLIVLPAGQEFDVAMDKIFLVSVGVFEPFGNTLLVNGRPQPIPLQLAL